MGIISNLQQKHRSFLGGIRKSFDHVFSTRDTHYRCTGNFAGDCALEVCNDSRVDCNLPNASLEITIVGGHNVDTVLDQTIHQAVIGICSLVVAFYSLEPRILGYPQSKSIFGAELFKFGKNAIRDDGNTFGIEAIHHCGNHFQFMLNGVGDEIGINQD